MWRSVTKEQASAALLQGREIKRACWKSERGIVIGPNGATYAEFGTECKSIPSLAYANDWQVRKA